ncbi:MAG: hypothetical protein KF744_13990 [Taibaiella sp.]|nr:hypothetical protein [Taibaiella sp.]
MQSLLRNILFALLLFPLFSAAQQREDNDGLESDPEMVTSWTALVRPTFSNPLTAYYRFVDDAGKYIFELKASAGGVPFIVTQGAKLELALENGNTVTLYNKKWQRACAGCGSKGPIADIPGVNLQFDLDKEDIDALAGSYLGHIGLHLTDNVLGGRPTLRRTETFREQADHFLYCVEHR